MNEFKTLNIISLVLILIALASVSTVATSDLGVYAQDSDIQLFQTCDSCSYVNLESVYFPNGSVKTFNSLMTKDSYTFNYSFSDSSQLGEYKYFVCGDKLGVLNCESVVFSVNTNGSKTDNGFNVFIMIIGTFIFIWTMLKISLNLDSEHFILKLLLTIISFILGLATINLGLVAMGGSFSLAVVNASNTIYGVSMLITYLFFAYISLYYIWKLFDWINENFIKRK